MKFYSNRLFTKSISLQEAIDKSKAKPPVRSIDQMLAEFDSKNAQVKTAATEAKVVKTASVVEVKTEAPKVEAAVVSDPKTDEMTKAAELVAKGEAVTLEEAKTKINAQKVEVKEAKKEAVILKIAKSLDFRKFEPEKVVEAWKQHGTLDKCVANVKGKTNDPKTYCSLLALANKESLERVKNSAKTAKKVEVKKAEEIKPFFKKIANLTAEEKSFLSKYFTKIYGQAFVDALLTEY